MKQLALLMLAILILGCETETPVTETPVVEEPEPVIEEPPPVVMEDEHAMPEDSVPPSIVEGSVRDGAVNVDPEPLNRDGMTFKFTENLRFYAADILREEKSLGWHPIDCRHRPIQTRRCRWTICKYRTHGLQSDVGTQHRLHH